MLGSGISQRRPAFCFRESWMIEELNVSALLCGLSRGIGGNDRLIL